MIGTAWMTYTMKSRRNVLTEQRLPVGLWTLKMMALDTRATVCSDTFMAIWLATGVGQDLYDWNEGF